MFKHTRIFCNPLIFSANNNQMNEIEFGYFIAFLNTRHFHEILCILVPTV